MGRPVERGWRAGRRRPSPPCARFCYPSYPSRRSASTAGVRSTI